MKKLFDKGLNLLKGNKLLEFFKRSENFAEKFGLVCLYGIFPILGIAFCCKYATGLDAMFGSAAVVALGFVVVCLILGYIADKMLEYVKPSIDQAKTHIVNGAFLDVLAFLSGIIALISGIVALVTICMGHVIFALSSLVVCGLTLYLAVMFLAPTKMLNVSVQDSATPAQSLIAITALLIKASYRLVPFAFGVAMLLSVANGIDLAFITHTIPKLTLLTFVYTLLYSALLPLIGYFVFLGYYFVLDLCMSLFRIADAVEGKNKAK